LVSATVALAILEIAIRIALPEPGYEPFPRNQLRGQLMPHPTRGYALRPGFCGDVERGARTVRVVVNEDGFVGRLVPSDGSVPVILAVGDSLTEGWGLREGEVWPAQLEQRLRAAGRDERVLNAAVFGYSLTQMRVTAAELIPKFRPRVVIAGLYLLGWSRVVDPYALYGGYSVRSSSIPFLTVRDDGFFHSAFRKSGLQALDDWLAHHLRTGSYLLRAAAAIKSGVEGDIGATESSSVSAEAVDAETLACVVRPFLDEIGRLAAVVRGSGADLIVLSMPIQDPLGRFDCDPDDPDVGLVEKQAELTTVVTRFCAEIGVVCVDMLPVLETAAHGEPLFCLVDDFHWSAAANALAADELMKVLPY
jgi:hypothetical protein